MLVDFCYRTLLGEGSALNSTPQKRGEIEDSSVNISLEHFVVWKIEFTRFR